MSRSVLFHSHFDSKRFILFDEPIFVCRFFHYLSVKNGKLFIVSIIGLQSSGKSTLLNHLFHTDLRFRFALLLFIHLQHFAYMHPCFSTMKLVEGQSKTTKGFPFTHPFPLRPSWCFLFIQQPRRRCLDVLY